MEYKLFLYRKTYYSLFVQKQKHFSGRLYGNEAKHQPFTLILLNGHRPRAHSSPGGILRFRIQDVFLVLGFAAPILLFISYWAAEGFVTPLSQRYSLYVAQDPTLPAVIVISFAVATFLSATSTSKPERHEEFFNQAARWFFLPVYLTIVLAVMLWYRFDFSQPFPAVSVFLLLGRTVPAALSILLPTLMILGLGILSLPNEAKTSLLHSVSILVGATLIFEGAFIQFLISDNPTGRLSLGYASAAGSAYVAMVVGGIILLYSLKRFVRGEAPTAAVDEEKS